LTAQTHSQAQFFFGGGAAKNKFGGGSCYAHHKIIAVLKWCLLDFWGQKNKVGEQLLSTGRPWRHACDCLINIQMWTSI